MKILLSVDAIFHPLTGIGRYTWELAEGLAQLAEPPELKYFAHGRLVGRPVVAAPGGGAGKASLAGLLRQRLAAIKPVVQLYSAVMPVVNAWRLKPYADHLFHASNYFIPPFGGRSVATVHDLSTLLYPQFHPAARVAYMNTELPRTLARAAHLITPSEYIRGEVIQHLNWPADKVTATHLGVDPRFQPHTAEQLAPVLATYGLAPGGYSLCVATLEPRKNIERLVTAYAALKPELQRQYPLVLAGSAGWNSEDLHRKIRQGQNSGLRYLDYVPQEHLYALYAGARLFAYPSLYEGFGLPVLEAMASGVPVLTSRNSSLTEVAGNAAWLVDALDVDAITQGIAQTLQDEGWRSQAITAGLAQAGALTWDACVRKTHQVYQKVGGLP